MITIEEFLLARIAEDEVELSVCRDLNWFPGKKYGIGAVSYDRLSAECTAKRAIMELADDATSLDYSVDNDRRVGTRDEAVEPYCGDSILRALAAPYSDHPDYQKEWDR